MPRALVMAERVVLQSVRTDFLKATTARRDSAAAVGANYWMFEHSEAQGTFLEFIEAGSSDALVAAVAALNATGADFPQTAPVWREVKGV